MSKVIHLVRTDTTPPRWICDVVADEKAEAGYRVVDYSGDMTPEVTERLHQGLGSPALTRTGSDVAIDGKGVGGGLRTMFPGDPDHLENAVRQIAGIMVSSVGRSAEVK